MSCCDKQTTTVGNAVNDVRDLVREGYARIAAAGDATAASTGGCCSSAPARQSVCCGGADAMTAQQLAQQVGYSVEELAALPQGTNMGLSCGNPTAIAALRPGQVVLDLGCGGGFDAFLAGPKVGSSGRVIGVDMTAPMLAKARAAMGAYRRATGLDNVEFRLGEIEHLPVADASVDVIISNCVINLSPDKAQVWREIARVLKPGGRVAVSDIALLRPLPEEVAKMAEAMVGCVAGAVLVDVYRATIVEVGLTDVRLTPKPQYVAALERMQDALYERIGAALPPGTRLGDYLTSLDVTAGKPAGTPVA